MIKGLLTATYFGVNFKYIVYFENLPDAKKDDWCFLHDGDAPVFFNPTTWNLTSDTISIIFKGCYSSHEASGFKTVGSVKTSLFIKEVTNIKKLKFILSDFL